MLCASEDGGVVIGKSSSKTGKSGQKAAITTIAARSPPSRAVCSEDCDGLGWYGVVVQQTESDATIEAALNLK